MYATAGETPARELDKINNSYSLLSFILYSSSELKLLEYLVVAGLMMMARNGKQKTVAFGNHIFC